MKSKPVGFGEMKSPHSPQANFTPPEGNFTAEGDFTHLQGWISLRTLSAKAGRTTTFYTDKGPKSSDTLHNLSAEKCPDFFRGKILSPLFLWRVLWYTGIKIYFWRIDGYV